MDNTNKGSIFEAIGRLIGYAYIVPFSFIGLFFILFGFTLAFGFLGNSTIVGHDGPYIFSGFCVLAGAVLQSSKTLRK